MFVNYIVTLVLTILKVSVLYLVILSTNIINDIGRDNDFFHDKMILIAAQ
jgi:hypothetical protein